MKVIDIIRKADEETVAKIIGATVVAKTENITMEEAVQLDYPATLKYLQSDMEIDYKPTTADRIRAMSDEELAAFLLNVETHGYHDESVSGTLEMIEWLQSEAK